MASSTNNLVCFIFFLVIISLQVQTHDARDIQVSRNREETTDPRPNNKRTLPFEEMPLEPEEKEEVPSFMPQTTHSGYGLYGHETGINAPTTTDTDTAATTATAVPSTLYMMDDNNHNYENQNNNNNQNQMNNNNENSVKYFYDFDANKKFDASSSNNNNEVSYSNNYKNNYDNGKLYGNGENYNKYNHNGNDMQQGYMNQFP